MIEIDGVIEKRRDFVVLDEAVLARPFDGPTLLKPEEVAPYIGPLTEQQAAERIIAPWLVVGYFAEGDERGRTKHISDQVRGIRAEIRGEAVYHLQELNSMHSQEDPGKFLTFAMGMTTLRRGSLGLDILPDTATYRQTIQDVDDFNERLNATQLDYWVRFFSPSKTMQYQAKLIGFAITSPSDEKHRTYVEPVMQSADGTATGLLPDGCIFNTSPVRIAL